MGKVVEVLVWAAVATGTWLLTLSSVTLPELVAAVATAVPCGVVATGARRALERSWAPSAAWARWLLPLPAAVAADTARVLGLAAGVLAGRRIPAGELRRVPLHRDRATARRAARNAVVAGLVSAAPGSLVLDVTDDDEPSALLHALGSGRPRLEEAVRR